MFKIENNDEKEGNTIRAKDSMKREINKENKKTTQDRGLKHRQTKKRTE